MLQRYSFSTQRPDRDSTGEWVRIEDVRRIVKAVIDESSPCTAACHSMVSDSVLDAACDAVGLRRVTDLS